MMAHDAVVRAPPHCLSARPMGKLNNKQELIISFSYSYTNIMSPSPILSPSNEEDEGLLTQPDAEADEAEAIDSDEDEERLLTQPDAEADKAESIDLTVESEAPNTKRPGPSKRKVITITPGSKTPNKKKQRSDISDADLDDQLKQVSTFNANDSILRAATKDNESKKAIKYFTMPVLGRKSSKWWEGF